MDKPNRHIAQLWHPTLDKNPIWILIKALFDRVVNSDRIDPRCARLHLRLRVVNTRLIIGELARQMQGWQAPMQPKMIAGKAHQHSAHTKIQPTGGNQGSHTRIHHRIAGLTLLPRGKIGVIHRLLAQLIIGRMHVFKFDAGLVFKLLNKMAMPMQAA